MQTRAKGFSGAGMSLLVSAIELFRLHKSDLVKAVVEDWERTENSPFWMTPQSTPISQNTSQRNALDIISAMIIGEKMVKSCKNGQGSWDTLLISNPSLEKRQAKRDCGYVLDSTATVNCPRKGRNDR
jgi:hypothetical protein